MKEPTDDDAFWRTGEWSVNAYHYPIDPNPTVMMRLWRNTWQLFGDKIANEPPREPFEDLFNLGPFVCSRSARSHQGPQLYAVDFLVPDNTTVRAMADGVVTAIVERHSESGDLPSFADQGNYVTIEHLNKECSQYMHLAQASVSAHRLKVGSLVLAGDPIALVGRTGFTDRDHLHVIVFRGDNNPDGYRSLQINWTGR